MLTRQKLALVLVLPVLLTLLAPSFAAACGGFFCTTVPVDQSAERIIFAMDEGRITTIVQINYTGSPDNCAWVLPVPNVPTLAVGDMNTFRDLDRMTAPLFVPPPPPDCLRRPIPMAAPAAAGADGVSVLASGTVGPFGYDVVTSPDPGEMVRWLRDNGYRIDPAMEPLIAVYTDEGMPFLAMKLQPGRGTSDITPIRLEYDSSQPMIPLRLTAVAAQPKMGVLVWVFGAGRTGPQNYVDMSISDGEVLFNPFGANNYRQVVAQAADQAGKRAFVTEYAGPTTGLRPAEPTAQQLVQKYPYLTRFYTRISPEDMTVDPVFDYAPDKGNVSNVHDLSKLPSPFDCSDDPNTFKPIAGAGPPTPLAQGQREVERLASSGAPRGGLVAVVLLGAGALVVSRRQRTRSLPVPPGDFGLKETQGREGRRARWRLTAQAARLLLLEAVVLQGFHEIEHIVQVVQRYWLGIKDGAGVLGSVFDLEPVHLAYNLTFLGLLALAYAGGRRDGAIPRRRGLVLALLGLALVGQAYHSLEHVVKIVQFLETGRNGTPGILGQWVPVVWLHFAFNTVIYAPVLAAFLLGGFPRAIGRDLAGLLPKAATRRWSMVALNLTRLLG
jgi:hypothetical protein